MKFSSSSKENFSRRIIGNSSGSSTGHFLEVSLGIVLEAFLSKSSTGRFSKISVRNSARGSEDNYSRSSLFFYLVPQIISQGEFLVTSGNNIRNLSRNYIWDSSRSSKYNFFLSFTKYFKKFHNEVQQKFQWGFHWEFFIKFLPLSIYTEISLGVSKKFLQDFPFVLPREIM